MRAIGVSHTACKDEFRRNLRSHNWSVFSFFIIYQRSAVSTAVRICEAFTMRNNFAQSLFICLPSALLPTTPLVSPAFLYMYAFQDIRHPFYPVLLNPTQYYLPSQQASHDNIITPAHPNRLCKRKQTWKIQRNTYYSMNQNIMA